MTRRLAGILVPSLVLLVDLSRLAQARDQNPNTSTTTPGGNLQEIVVTGAQIPINEAVVPTVRPTNAAYGLDLNVMEIPRNITIISRAQLDDISVRDVRNLTKLTTSSFTTTNFDAPANPSIRGQTADVFVNGMREGLTSNGNGLPIDFNSFDSVDIIKGPPSVVYGASNYVGGYFNFVTKQPYFDRLQATLSATVGTYEQYRWNVDIGGPIIPEKLAFRISYSGENSGSYYENQVTETHSIYAALTWIPSDKYKLEANADFWFGTYQEVTAFDDYFDEPLNAWDISKSRSFIQYRAFSAFTAQPVPNQPGWSATPGIFNSDTNYSKLFTIAPFYEHIFEFGDHFSLLAGARADIMWVKVNDPLYFEAVRAGFAGPGGSPGDHTVVVEHNFNISPVFKPTKWLTTYFTYNYSQAYAAGNGEARTVP